MLNTVIWTANPTAFSIGPVEVRWYGLLFALGFLIGYYIEAKIFKHDKAPDDWCDKLFVYTIIATIIGARLGHCLFYEWDYFSAHPLEILKVWEGGLASHGGAIGIIIAIYIYTKRVTHRGMLWVLDRLVIPTALVAAMIRTGNLMNHEIYGVSTNLPWGFIFIENIHAWQAGFPAKFSMISHPTQIYEASAYLILFFVLMYMYWKKDAGDRRGLLFGTFMLWVFGARFLIEFLKLPQEPFEIYMKEIIGLNMGQVLSIPFIILGIYFVYKGKSGHKKSGVIKSRNSHIRHHYNHKKGDI